MTTPAFSLLRKTSVDRGFDQIQQRHPFLHELPCEPRFFTEQEIPFHATKYGNKEHNKKVRFNSAIKPKYEDPLSVLDEHQRLEYSSTDQFSEISPGLAGLDARSGHSFQKEKIEFSLSNEILDTDHQNMLLRKKCNQMKKQLTYLRDSEQKMLNDIINYREKAQKSETLLLKLKQQIQLSRQKVAELQKQLRGRDRRIDDLQKLLASSEKKKNNGKISIMLQEGDNVKDEIMKYEEEISRLKEHHEQQLFENSREYSKIIETVNSKFEHAKKIGQFQIDQLVLKLTQKDQEIILLRQKIAQFDFKCRMSTLVSENVDHSCAPKSPDQKNINAYTNRFLQFSQFIDERIHKSLEKERTQMEHERITKSALQKPTTTPFLREFREYPGIESPQSNRLLNIQSVLHQKPAKQNHLFKSTY